MIKVLFFAQTKELIGLDSIQVDLDKITAQTLRQHLSEKGDAWSKALKNNALLVAVNQDMVPMNTVIHAGDEVAFFPPVTGG